MTAKPPPSDTEIERAVSDGKEALVRANLMVRASREFLLVMKSARDDHVRADAACRHTSVQEPQPIRSSERQG